LLFGSLLSFVAMGFYTPLDMVAYMETPDDPTCMRVAYPAEHICKENAFDGPVLEALVTRLIAERYLVDVTVKTGGGRGGVRFPEVTTLRGNPDKASVKANNQFKLSAVIGGQPAFQQVGEYCRLHNLQAPLNFNATNLSLSNLMWRYNHRNADGSFPLVPVVAEISHHAEGYSAANSVAWGAAKVELSELESHAANESRKCCTQFGLMWRKPDGSLIGEFEDYAGPSLCFHGAYGTPCYAPHPVSWTGPTGATPNPRKTGGGKKRKDGEGGSGMQKRKSASHDKGQRRLSFGATPVTK
jgi:hypothetical protein